MSYVCYLLTSETSSKTYVGITKCITKRLKQHNGEYTGGAKYTCQGRPWKVYGFVTGFGEDKSYVLKFEWRWKYLSRKEKGETIQRRIKAVQKLLQGPSEYIKGDNVHSNLEFILLEN